jgi:hypothetical protein
VKITSIDIIGELERLAAAFPWDSVDLWITREPEGRCKFTAYIRDNAKFGFPSLSGWGDTPSEAVDCAVTEAANRDPERARKQKLAELKAQIEKLHAVVIGLPPYRPNRELSNGEPAIKVNETVNV